MRTNSALPGAPGRWILLLSLAACGSSSLPQGPNQDPAFDAANTSTTVTVADVEFTQFVDCAGENVLWTGTGRFLVHTTRNRGVPELPPGVFQHEVELESLHLTGVGETSGARYSLNSKVHVTGQSESPTDPFPTVFRITLRELVTRQPGGTIGEATFSIDVVLNGTGDLVVEKVDDFTIECR